MCGGLAALAVALVFAANAGAGTVPVEPGEYTGMTTQLCPAFGVSAGMCEERERLPMSLVVRGTKVTAIEATLAERCEDDLRPRLVEVEIPHSYELHREGAEPNVQVSFNLRSSKQTGSQADGWFKHGIGKGDLNFVEKDPEEKHNLYGKPEHAALQKDLTQRLDRLASAVPQH